MDILSINKISFFNEYEYSSKWAIQDSNLTSENTASDIENAENSDSSIEGVAESTAVENKSEQMLQLLALLQGLSSDELDTLLRFASEFKQR